MLSRKRLKLQMISLNLKQYIPLLISILDMNVKFLSTVSVKVEMPADHLMDRMFFPLCMNASESVEKKFKSYVCYQETICH